MVESFDVVVIGGGSGLTIVERALNENLKVALIEMGPLGGTCLNRGCIPTKMLIYPADLIRVIEKAGELGVYAKIEKIDHQKIFNRMRKVVAESSEKSAKAAEKVKRLKWFRGVGEFIDEYKLKVGYKTITGEKIFIVSGSRPDIPPIEGLDKVQYYTSDTILHINRIPSSLIIIGGGYVSAEYGHFFSSMGCKVSIIHKESKVLHYLDSDIVDLFNQEFSKYVNLLTSRTAVKVSVEGELKKVTCINTKTNREESFNAEEILIAAGRRSNSDLLKPELTGVKLTSEGYIQVNEYLETSKENIWAAGDAIGKYMFKHVANYEVEVAWYNSKHGEKIKMDYTAIPAAVFSHPQIAHVGLTAKEAVEKGFDVVIGTYRFKDVAMGEAMGSPNGLVKIVVNKNDGRILGAQIVGPDATILIQEIVNVMNCQHGSVYNILRALHIHPALPEVVQRACANLKEANT
ncbi:MAG: dihydrolipoyl dehydrogenase [Candidatus Odinarchaeum yellowstonii]|uniref:Dihydrolipoyl dehydrogenase n=1 Tax=Odinarchaeota yellowstonii (strain LCB_4) TaxID=1841599 RepID=A0AAF0ICR7_ODILC|nr:MAG: dihydrolipoyl dehydrogenase [Candidatus Odinarchaeum yellowstonii]